MIKKKFYEGVTKMNDAIDIVLSGLNDDAKEKAKEAIEKAIKQKVKKELRKRRRKVIKRVVVATAAAVGVYLVVENREQIFGFVLDKVDEVQKKIPTVKIKIKK